MNSLNYLVERVSNRLSTTETDFNQELKILEQRVNRQVQLKLEEILTIINNNI